LITPNASGAHYQSRKHGCGIDYVHTHRASQFADKAIVSLNAVTRLEKGKVDSRVSTITAIEKTLSKAGVEFLPPGEKGEGVRMKSPKA
jgi:transcriptional regulator with XRE-family HTH domain